MTVEQEDLGPVATRVLFENERVRVWEMDLQPGGCCATHQHTLDYLLYIIRSGRLRVEPRGGKPFTFDFRGRSVYFVPAGGVESATNVGESRFWEVMFELKESLRRATGRPGYAASEALAGQPPEAGTINVLENDSLRVVEMTLRPGQQSSMHYCPRDAAAFVIEGAPVEITERLDSAEPRVETLELATGSVRWLPRGCYRNIINLGPGRYRQVSVELK